VKCGGLTDVVGETQATYNHYQTLSENETTTHTCRTHVGDEEKTNPITGEVTTSPIYSYQDYTNTGCNNGPPADQCTASNQSWVSHDYGDCDTYNSEMNARSWSLTANAYTVPSGAVDWPGGSLTPTCEPQLDKLTFDEWWDTYTIVDQQMQAVYGPEWANAAILTYQFNRLMLLEGTDQNFCERNPGACDALMAMAGWLQNIRPGTPNYCDYHPADCAAWEWAKGLPSAPIRLWDYFTTALPSIGSQEYGVPSATFPLMIELMLFDAGPNGRIFDETAYVQSRINQAQLYQMQRGFGNTAQLTLEGTSAAFDTYFLAGAAYQGGRFAYNAFGRTGWNTARSGVAAAESSTIVPYDPDFAAMQMGQISPQEYAAIQSGMPNTPYLGPVESSGSAVWRSMGVNRAGTRFFGPDRIVYTDNVDLINAMDQHGPGIVIDGAHGTPTGEFIPFPKFYEDTAEFFKHSSNPYSGQVSVLDINQLSKSDIQSLGAPGETAYVNWCWGGFCNDVRDALTIKR
jgi:hypothetical protein